jgi:ATP-dependent Clp protease ATP-binding subunit ClpA
MDHGTLTDNNGRKTDFRNVILVMTTNAGAAQMSRASIGFTHQDHSTDGGEELKKMFTPEFRNRLDNIIQFEALGRDTILHVVDKFLAELQGQLDDKGVMLNISEGARLWLAEHGYDEKMGARPMARLVQDKIKKPLAEKILFGELSKGGEIEVQVSEGELVLELPEVVPA